MIDLSKYDPHRLLPGKFNNHTIIFGDNFVFNRLAVLDDLLKRVLLLHKVSDRVHQNRMGLFGGLTKILIIDFAPLRLLLDQQRYNILQNKVPIGVYLVRFCNFVDHTIPEDHVLVTEPLLLSGLKMLPVGL